MRKIDELEHQILPPAFAKMHPKSTPPQIARAAESGIKVLVGRGAERIVVLLDHEDNPDCPGRAAGELKEAFVRLLDVTVDVVVKNRTFENWLVADPDAIEGLKGRFTVTRAFRQAVSPNKADHVQDAEALLNQVAKARSYHKRQDAVAIAREMVPLRAAANSRSFRRFLRIIGHPRYEEQSKRP